MLLRKFFGVFLCIYLQIVIISCEEGGSLAFAIDDTFSMNDDIKYVKQGAEAIMKLVLSKKSDIKELVLVTFNDPKVELRTKNSAQHTFLNDLQFIKPHGGGDCPEMALTGIEEALKASSSGSYIYVFTDANAKDYDKVKKIQSLCQKKQSQVVIVYSQDTYCFQPTGVQFNVYYEIAKACSGQVFIVQKNEVDSVLKTIETLLQGKNSIFKWIMVPRTNSYVSVQFTLDDKAEYAIVSTSGTNVDLQVTRNNYFNGPQVNYEKTMWNVNGKVVKLIDPSPGIYYAWVKGESIISVVVYGRTDFTFEHGFSILEPKLMADTSKQPKAGLKQHVSINVTDPDNSVNIQTVQIVDIKNDERIVYELPLRNIGKNFYITEAFVSPAYTFRIAVKGEIKMTNKPIKRISKNIDPQIVDLIPESIPDVKIDEGITIDVNYGAGVSLTCKVTAHPAPKIEWYTSSGVILPSQSSVIDDPLFVSYLKLENMKQSETYVCKASNKNGVGKDTRIQVNVRPIFTKIGEVAFNAKYGEDVKIPCNIKSYLPITIKWYRSGKQLYGNSGKYSISSDGSELILRSMNLDMQGKYTCEATLNSDPKIKQTHDRDVILSGLVHPKVTSYKTVLNGKHFKAICRIEGVPKPIISWQFKPKGSNIFSVISGSGEELNIPEVRLKDTGVYKCKARNFLGETEHDFDVVVEEQPIIHEEESTHYGVEGDIVMKISCNVTGFPEPTIVWKKGGKALKMDSKNQIRGTTLYINMPVQSDSAQYTCEAKNKLGTAKKTFVVEVVDNFENEENFNGNTRDVYAEQGKIKAIKCNLKNVGEGSVRWYKDGMLTKQTGSTYTIERASIADEGNYTCRVNTNEGSKSETYALYVGYLPIFEDNSPSPQTINWQEVDQMLDCAADSQPPARYEWVHNEKIVEDGNYLQQIPITNWGEYTCHVSNVLGKISKTFKVITSGCYITKNTATPNQPLVSEIDKPTWPNTVGNSDLLLKGNDEIKLSCPNTKTSTNTFNILPGKKEMIAKCNTQDKFIVEGNTYKYSDLQCNTKVEPSVKRTQNQCSGPNSEIIRVGFEVNGFMEAYKVCYDKTLHVPIYASASTSISKNGDGVDSMKFKWSSAPELGNRKIGNWKPEGSCKCCYTRGQLVNFKELAFGPAQAATFKDNLNSVPIWNPSCDGSKRTSWQTFDNEIRDICLTHDKWSVSTGASEYSLKDGGLVPRYLWKVINYDEGFTVMVYVNDKYPVESDIRCSSPCESMMEADKFLYCCTIDEFKSAFGYNQICTGTKSSTKVSSLQLFCRD